MATPHGSSRRGQWMQERPVSHQIKREKVASHPVVEPRVAHDEEPFSGGGDSARALEGLECLFA